MTPCLAQRLRAVAFDLAFGDGPDRPDLAGADLPPLDLGEQRRRRQPESGRRLCECEHLAIKVGDERCASLVDDSPDRQVDALAPYADVAGGARHGSQLLEGGHLADQRRIETGFAEDLLGGHFVSLRGDVVHASNVADARYVVKHFLMVLSA